MCVCSFSVFFSSSLVMPLPYQSQEESLQRTIAIQKENERQLVQRNRVLSGKLKAEQEECRRLRLCMGYKEQQYSHEVKKKDREYTRLKERLGQVCQVSGPSVVAEGGMVVVPPPFTCNMG